MNDSPIVLFGAFDRHNLGDFLLAHAAVRRAAPRPCLFAGLRAVDLTACGGFAVEPIGRVLAEWRRRYGDAPLDLVHVGGEILDTDAWEAAVMLLDPQAAAETIARLDRDADGRQAWATQMLGRGGPASYVIGRGDIGVGGSLEFRGVGGVGLAQRPANFRQAVLAALADADRLSVRDWRTRDALTELGIEARLEADPATTLGPWLAAEVEGVQPVADDYVAVQFAASFGDDATLAALAASLNALPRRVVLFRAGAAPWHDDTAVYARLQPRLHRPALIMESLHVRDICALVAGARGCLASSLHAILVAGLFGVPACGLERRPGEGAKLRAYAETWGGFAVATPDSIPIRLLI